MTTTAYLVALGSNQRHSRYGPPESVIAAALHALDTQPLALIAPAQTIRSRPLGPSMRTYANSAALIATALNPAEVLHHLKAIERTFGRRARGGRWRARVLDLDIILWSGGRYTAPGLAIPHPAFRARAFVLTPLADIAAEWRDPITKLHVRHLKARLDRKAIHP